MGGPHLPLKQVGVIADCHSEGQQLFERLLRVIECHRNLAGLEPDARREISKFLIHNLNRGLDQKLRPFEALSS